MRSQILLLVTAVLLAAGPANADDKAPAKAAAKDCHECCAATLKVGAVAYSPKSVDVFRGMRYYFAKAGIPIEFVLYSTYDGLCEALQNKQVDVAWNSPLGHAKFHLLAGDSQAIVMRDVDRGYRVKLNELLGPNLALIHGCFAQLVFALIVTIAVVTGKKWLAGVDEGAAPVASPRRIESLAASSCSASSSSREMLPAS